jgi:hypothetical protein
VRCLLVSSRCPTGRLRPLRCADACGTFPDRELPHPIRAAAPIASPRRSASAFWRIVQESNDTETQAPPAMVRLPYCSDGCCARARCGLRELGGLGGGAHAREERECASRGGQPPVWQSGYRDPLNVRRAGRCPGVSVSQFREGDSALDRALRRRSLDRSQHQSRCLLESSRSSWPASHPRRASLTPQR